MSQTPSFVKLRQDFPMLHQTMHGHPLIYFDSAATAQKPQCVIDTITDFYSHHYGTVHRAVYELSVFATQEYEATRKKVQTFLNAVYPQEIVFTRGTTDAINLVASSFGSAFLKPGDEVLISEMEHHSNIVPWQLACQARNAILKVIPIDDQGKLILERYQELLSERTKIVAITHISNALGTVNPIRLIVELAHQYGAKVLVDGAQAAPHQSIDVQALDVDFYAFSGHKACGPTGIGILYGKKEILESLPPYQGGGDMIRTVSFSGTTYNDLPLKFEAGTPLIAEVLGLGSAIDYLTAIGMSHIQQQEHELLLYATEKMKGLPFVSIIGNAVDKGAIISFVADGVHPLDIGTMLDLKGIAVRTGHHCAQPLMQRLGVPGTARASFAFYNTKSEIDYFIEALRDAIAVLR